MEIGVEDSPKEGKDNDVGIGVDDTFLDDPAVALASSGENTGEGIWVKASRGEGMEGRRGMTGAAMGGKGGITGEGMKSGDKTGAAGCGTEDVVGIGKKPGTVFIGACVEEGRDDVVWVGPIPG